DRPLRIKAQAFPYREIDIELYLADLERMGFIDRYEVGGVRVIQVLNFTKHQAPHQKEKASELPSREKVRPSREKVRPSREKVRPSPSDSGLLTPDSGLLTPDVLTAKSKAKAKPCPRSARTCAASQPREKEEKEADPRCQPFIEILHRYWQDHNNIAFIFDASEGKALKLLLGSSPHFTVEQ